MTTWYTGLGSQKTPAAVCRVMEGIGRYAAGKGLGLRSGAMDGAAHAFEQGCGNGPKVILLPWPKYNEHPSSWWITKERLGRVKTHEVWGMLREALAREQPVLHLDAVTPGQEKCFAAAVYQVLGEALDDPSSCVICWTANGTMKGLTRIALYAAKYAGVPIYNLAISEVQAGWSRRVGVV
jgi:hypothetical protein